jgi:DNA-directed RNA polymerase specialized sigma24 family protein
VSHAAQADAFDRRQLVERTIVQAMRSAPAVPFASMPAKAREAVALARLAGYSAREIALALDVGVPEAKRLLRAGLDAARYVERPHETSA